MMKRSIVKEKSKVFALHIIDLYKLLKDERKEYVISKQILRSGTSIGANVNEALCSITKKEFLSKMYVSYKEASESQYWLELLNESNYINDDEFDSIYHECDELKRMLSSITKTTKENLHT